MILNEDDFSFILNTALASAQVESISLPNGKNIRPQIHTLIYGAIGTGKSTILNDIGKARGITPVLSLSKAHIMGAVDQVTGTLIFPIIWEHRNDCVLIDEFHLDKRDFAGREALYTMLSVMEHPEFKKKVGYRCEGKEEKDGELYCQVKDHTIKCKTRFVFIANTMMNLGAVQMIELRALISRCILIPFSPDFDQLRSFARGEVKYYKYKPFKIRKKRVKISKKVYEKIINFVDSADIKQEKYLRTIGDICRFYAVHGKFVEEKFRKVLELTTIQ